MTDLDDGTYDVLVVDAETADDDRVRLELALVSGPHKGAVVAIRMPGAGADPLELLGLPGRLRVAGGQPAGFEVDR